MWVRWWSFKWLEDANDLSHTSQGKGFSPVCVRICNVRWVFCEQVYSHCVQAYGCFFVCVSMCRFILVRSLNFMSHTPHSNFLGFGLSLPPRCWVHEWLSKWCFSLNLFWQTSHFNGLAPVCPSKWRSKRFLIQKPLLQYVQTKGLWIEAFTLTLSLFDTSGEESARKASLPSVVNFLTVGMPFDASSKVSTFSSSEGGFPAFNCLIGP